MFLQAGTWGGHFPDMPAGGNIGVTRKYSG
jgi:hypothetical protein